MKKNPKTIAGLIGLAVLLVLCVILATYMIPTISEVRREMSLTPTPLPPVPDTVRARDSSDLITPDPALHNGSQGEKVWKLQERLRRGRNTEGAVQRGSSARFITGHPWMT